MNSFPGATPTFFFAPTQAQKRTEEWGPGEVQKRIGMGLKKFQIYSDNWMEVKVYPEIENVNEIFSKIVRGDIKPSNGYIVTN